MPAPRISRRALRAASALGLAVGAGLAMTVALPTSAGAATAPATVTKTNDNRLVYKAAPGQVNKVTAKATSTDGGDSITYVIDDVVPVSIAAGVPCTHPTASDLTKISCQAMGGSADRPFAVILMSLGDRDDSISYDNATGQALNSALLMLGSGNDKAVDTGQFDGNEIDGEDGNDSIVVGTDAIVFGDAGNDTVRLGARSRALTYAGNDTVYADGVDSWVDAGPGNDHLYGGAGKQTLNGDAGNDTIRGGTGDDVLHGNAGNDILYGNSGNDFLYGEAGNDKLYGGPGHDKLSGGAGSNVVHQD
ncbi:calcium-binding protein [Streptomyces sp. MBT65]|uniref:calcium-binding protein n=1 Tax=Streptomyces sp. MBT65 TaxID=1488395 RepID=UPI00190DF109|nr:calcium-binding protein [Streptomyces sp. MBT65]MBK3575616.1 calcium-binding protein [Streptomyces sp. MBT65]